MSKGLCSIVTIMVLGGLAIGQEAPPRLGFVAGDKGAYTFDTSVLRGALCSEGKPRGLSSVTHVPSGAKLDGGAGILGYYRVFTTNKRYGTAAWEWPGAAKLLPDGAVQVTWPEAADRPFEMTAMYRWKDPQTLDVETTATARKDLSKFEVFLASYFDQAFASPSAYVAENPETQGKPGFLLAKKSCGDWQMFPRDAEVVPIMRDGRWQIEPNPVNWTIMPRLNAPICLRRKAASGLTAILMAPPEDCFAIATPYDGETHYSLYLSLFGRDIKVDETAKARTRFVITPAASEEQVLTLYRQYMDELSQRTRPTAAADKR
jgi:hypothetical protein